ncbi:recombinase RarA, partial [Staphylococcus aureus]|nr:recombinase RarA [Staphylococcus aureus]
HQYVNGYVSQQYLPDKLKNKIYYEPKTTSKSEQQLKEIYNNLLKQRP